MPRPLKRGILGASTIILSKDIDKYAFTCGSNFYETDVNFIHPILMLHNRSLAKLIISFFQGLSLA